MSGLYEKALKYRNTLSQFQIVEENDESGRSNSQIPDAEYAEILGKIDKIAERNRLAISSETFDYTPEKAGGVFPVLVNLIAIALIAGGIFALTLYFNNREQSIATGTNEVITAESQVIAALKLESDQRLALKDKEIGDIASRLEAARFEREQLQNETDTIVAEREEVLKSEFEQLLEAERNRLSNQGLTEEDLTKQLNDFEDLKREEYDQSLALFRSQSEDALRQQEAAMASAIESFESELQAAQSDRQDLEQEYADRESELADQFAQREEALSAERSAALAELESIREGQQRIDLVNDQILAAYDGVNTDLTIENYDDALSRLSSLEKYLLSESVITLPGVSDRLIIERFIINSLRDLIGQRRKSVDTASLLAASDILTRIQTNAQKAGDAYTSGDAAEADTLYRSAFSMIPELSTGLSRIVESASAAASAEASAKANAEAVAAARTEIAAAEVRAENAIARAESLTTALESRNSIFITSLAEGDISYDLGDFQSSVGKYKAAITSLGIDDEVADGLITNLLSAGNQILGTTTLAERDGLRSQVETLNESISVLQSERDALLATAAASETTETSTAAAELSELETQIEELTKEKTELELALANAEKQAVALTTTISTLTEENSTLLSSLDFAKEEQDSLSAALADAKTTESSLEKLLADSKTETARISSSISELQNDKQRLEQAAAKYVAEKAEWEKREQLISAYVAKIQTLKLRYQTRTTDADSVDPFTLLQTKLVLKQVLESDAVKTAYPELDADFDAFFDAFGTNRNSAGRLDALSEMDRVVTSLRSTSQTANSNTETEIMTNILFGFESILSELISE